MISFTIALLALVVGYLFYGKFIEHVMVRVAEVDLKRKRIGLSMKNVK